MSFHDPGALDAFPGLTFNACMEAMHLVTADGKVYTGFEAAARAVAMRPLVGAVAYAYYVPGVRQLCDIAYKLVARYRYQLMGRRTEECDGGSCSLHFKR